MHLMFEQYDERLGRRGAAPNTLKNFRRTAALFEESGLDPLTACDQEIEEWLAGLPMSPRTRRLHFENLSAAYGYAVYRRQLPASPCEVVRLPREPDREPRVLSNDELRHILGNCATDGQCLMASTLIYTGMRRNELRNLRWEDIAADSVTVVGKGGKLRHIPIHPALSEEIVRHTPTDAYVFPGRRGGVMADSTLFYALEKIRGDVRCTFHDFRRTVATNLAEGGVQPMVIDKIMGWAPRTVGSRYYIRTADRSMQAAILSLYADDPLTHTSSRTRCAARA